MIFGFHHLSLEREKRWQVINKLRKKQEYFNLRIFFFFKFSFQVILKFFSGMLSNPLEVREIHKNF